MSKKWPQIIFIGLTLCAWCFFGLTACSHVFTNKDTIVAHFDKRIPAMGCLSLTLDISLQRKHQQTENTFKGTYTAD